MTLIKHSLLTCGLLLSTSFIFTSCNNDDTNTEIQNTDTSNKLSFEILEKGSKNRNTVNSVDIIYNKTTVVSSSIDIENNLISYDYDNDGNVDIYAERIENSDLYIYKDASGVNIAKAMITQNGNQWNLKIIELYEDDQNKQSRGKMGGFRKCFQDVAGSVEGIALTTASGFAGPWGPVGVLGGVAIGCAIWG